MPKKHGVEMRRAVASIAPSAILTATRLHAFVEVQISGEIFLSLWELVLSHSIYYPHLCGSQRSVKKRIEDALWKHQILRDT